MSLLDRHRRFLHDRTGVAAVEFALILPILVLILGGVLDLGRMLWFQSEVSQALRAGMQYAMLNPGDTSGITATVKNSTALWPSDNFQTSGPTQICTCSDGSNIDCSLGTCADGNPKQYYIQVSASFSYKPFIGTMGGLMPKSVTESFILRMK